jgi:hypothetical protein
VFDDVDDFEELFHGREMINSDNQT